MAGLPPTGAGKAAARAADLLQVLDEQAGVKLHAVDDVGERAADGVHLLQGDTVAIGKEHGAQLRGDAGGAGRRACGRVGIWLGKCGGRDGHVPGEF